MLYLQHLLSIHNQSVLNLDMALADAVKMK